MSKRIKLITMTTWKHYQTTASCMNAIKESDRNITLSLTGHQWWTVELLRVHILLPGYPLTNTRRVPRYQFNGCRGLNRYPGSISITRVVLLPAIYSSNEQIHAEMEHWAIPFFVRTPPMDDVRFPAGFFFILHYGRCWIFIKKIAISSIPYTGFCVCRGYGWPWISEKFAVSSNIHIQLYLWKMLDFRLDFI